MDAETEGGKPLPDYYAVLGVAADANGPTIERAYEKLARKYQPNLDEPPLDAERMRELDEAFDALDVPAKRAEYDRALAAAGQTPAQLRGRFLSRRPVRVAIAASALGAAVACAIAVVLIVSGGGAGSEPTPIPTLRILAPMQGAKVTSPVTVEVASTHLIAPPELNIPNAAHYHVFVDKIPFTASGKVIPTDEEGIYHFTSNTLQLDLKPGAHTIILALGDNSHVRVPESEAHAVSVDVIVEATPGQ